jgi:hypothetical protein
MKYLFYPFILFLLVSCGRKLGESKLADSMMTPAPVPPTANYKGVSSSTSSAASYTSNSTNNSNDNATNLNVDNSTNDISSQKALWKELRNSAGRNRGKKVYFELKIYNTLFSDGTVNGFLDGDSDYPVTLDKYHQFVGAHEMVKVHDGDWVNVHGDFIDVNSTGDVEILATSLENLGIR